MIISPQAVGQSIFPYENAVWVRHYREERGEHCRGGGMFSLTQRQRLLEHLVVCLHKSVRIVCSQQKKILMS